MKLSIYAVVAASIAGCAEGGYVYTPETPNAVTAGLPAARTEIPQEHPQGSVEITSYGVTELKPPDVPALHVRMIVANDGDATPWQLDPSQQFVQIAGEGRSAPLYVNSDVRTMPTVTIAQHQRRVLDFYFPLPATIRDDRQLPHFDVQWQVITPERTVASSTAFDRVQEQPQYAYGYASDYDYGWPYWAGYGPYWWYDPFYGAAVFVHPRHLGGPHHGPIAVGRFGGHFRAGGARVGVGGHGRR